MEVTTPENNVPPPPPLPFPKTTSVSPPITYLPKKKEPFPISRYIKLPSNDNPKSIAVYYKDIEPVLQEGPCCGIVALSMASQFPIGKRCTAEEILAAAKSMGFTKSGEMFSARNMATLAESLLGCKAAVVSEKATVESEKATVVSEKATVVSEKATVVSEKATVESEKVTVVSEKATVESEKVTVVSEKATVESEKATAESEKATVESEVLNHKNDILSCICQGYPVLFPYDADKNHQPCLNNGKTAHWALLNGLCLEVPQDLADSGGEPWGDVDFAYRLSSEKSMEKYLNSSTKAYVFAYQGKSKHMALWDFESLLSSNRNMFEAVTKYGYENMILPNENDALCELRYKAVLLEKENIL